MVGFYHSATTSASPASIGFHARKGPIMGRPYAIKKQRGASKIPPNNRTFPCMEATSLAEWIDFKLTLEPCYDLVSSLLKSVEIRLIEALPEENIMNPKNDLIYSM